MSLRAKRADREGAFSGNKAERAIIDIGSNTVRVVVYGGSMRAPTVLLNEKVTARLGREIAETGRLADEAIDLAMRGLKRFVLLLQDLGVSDIVTVATAAVRDASNGSKFVSEVRSLGLDPQVISGLEEGRLSASGVLGAFPGASGVVGDLGGGSLELVRLENDEAKDGASLPLGTLRLPEHLTSDVVQSRKNLEKVLKKGDWGKPIDSPLYLVGGTWRALAVYAMQAQSHPLSDPHGFELATDEAWDLADELASQDASELKSMNRISSMRAEKLPKAAVLLQALISRLEPTRLIFSSWGLREGLLYDRLEPHAKSQDPLLAGIAVFAAQRGAPPTLATRMAGWTVDAVPAGEHGSERLRLASTMLALASMQIEPNIRHPQAIDWALHKRWIAVDDKGRAMMAAAIAANGNHLDMPAMLVDLAGEEALNEAISWGLAVRLARRIGARSRRSLQMSRLVREEGHLVLRMAESHADLIGVPTEKDMKLLAGHLGLDWDVEIVPDGDDRPGEA
jgi:exopolyphosphatase/guanosine-5'-triphosphate,3'-diphosphate pyrophosphatase